MAQLIQAIKRRDYQELRGPGGEVPFNQSKAKHAVKSAWHYWMKYENPDRPADKETDNMLRGSLVHEMALEGVEPEQLVAVFDGQRRGKAWDNHKLKCEREGLLAITSESGTINYRDLMGATAAAKEALHEQGADADPECAVLFQMHGLWCKALLDKLSSDNVIFDLKVTEYIEEREFLNQALKPDFQYDYQIAWYERAVMEAFDLQTPPQHVFICVQPTYPYEWNVHTLCREAVDMAHKKIERSIKNLVNAVTNKDWTHPKRTPNVLVPALYHYENAGEYQGAVSKGDAE